MGSTRNHESGRANDRFRVQSTRLIVFALGLCALSAVARAQSRGDKAGAEALFDEGRRLAAAGQYSEACAKFEASQAMDPGVGTMLNLADCYEKQGRTASAWAQFRETVSAARKAGSADRERVARQRVQQLEQKLSYLTIVTWKGQDVSVTRDDVAVDPAVLGTAIPTDPGTHTIAASAPGKRSWSTKVEIGAEADRVSVAVPILAEEAPASDASAKRDGLQPSAAESTSGPRGSPGATQRILGIVAAAIGVAGIATGTVFGVKAASNWSDAKANCEAFPQCSEAGRRLGKDAEQSGDISTISFIAGGVFLAGGAVLFLTAPSAPRERPQLEVGLASLRLRGQF
jgi:hypothetical protein